MESFKIVNRFTYFFLFFILIVKGGWTNSPPSSQDGKILFLIQKGEHKQALNLYRQDQESQGNHDFELLHRIGLTLLDYGFRQEDPEIQLLSIFGASISAHDEAFYILEEGLKSRYPQIQLIALQALAKQDNHLADQALNRAMGSPHLLIRLEAAVHLCQKRHPQAISQIEALMYKTPATLLPLYPQFYAMSGDHQSIKLLRKLLNHSSEKVRVAAILSIAKYMRDDLLPQIRQQASQLSLAQQEASAYALGVLKDEKSIQKLKKLSDSKCSSVALSAQQALYRLGEKEELKKIFNAAKNGDLFAITLLGKIPEGEGVLLELINHPDLQIRMNSTLALLEQGHSVCLKNLKEILIRDKRDLAFSSISSPGGSLKSWKVFTSASGLLKEDVSAYLEDIELKEVVLEKTRELGEEEFIQIGELILNSHQPILIPSVVQLLEEIGTPQAIQILMTYQQKPGAPFIRQYCNLALYRLKEPGHYKDQLQQWVKSQNHQDLIRFRPFTPWEGKRQSYQLTPEETSRLLIESFEAFTLSQDEEGIEMLLEAIANGHPKNKYALAGLLLRATQ
jgi:HEAT repeat protein